MNLIWLILEKVIVLTVGIFYFRYLPLAYKLCVLQVALAIIAELGGRYINRVYHQQNLWLFNTYLLVGELWVTGFVPWLLLRNARVKQMLLISLSLISVLSLINYIADTKSIFRLQSGYILIQSVHCIVFYLILLFQDTFSANGSLLKVPVFWLSLSAILFFSCCIPVFGLFNYLDQNYPLALKQLFGINQVFNLVRYPMVAVSFYLIAYRPTGKNSPGHADPLVR